MTALFDSIAQQYPIGSLILWDTTHPPKSRATIGPFTMPKGERQWLILDGQQRLTTIAGVLLRGSPHWDATDDEDPERWSIYYDAGSGIFTHWSPPTGATAPPPQYVAVDAMLDVVRFLTWAATARDAGLPDAMIRKITGVSRAIQSYRIPVVVFTTNSLTIAVESFARLNSRGHNISKDEMFSALTYDGGFSLEDEIGRLQSESVRGQFGKVDRNILLRAILTAAGLDIYRTDWSRLGADSKAKTRDQLPQAVIEARSSLAHARQFLADLGVLNARMLPHSMQLVVLSAFFLNCTRPTDAQRAFLTRWFWVSAFTGWFGARSSTQVRHLVEEFRDVISKTPAPTTLDSMDLDEPALPTPSRFDMRSARVRALVCVLLKEAPRGLDNQPMPLKESAQMLLGRGPGAMGRLFATVHDDELRVSPANRILDIEPQSPGQAVNWLKDLKDKPAAVREAILKSHVLPTEGYSLLMGSTTDRTDFLRLRMTAFAELEHEFMQTVGVVPGRKGFAPSPIDADDDVMDDLEI